MIKILSSAQIRELDAYTIAHEPITSLELMERACQAFVHWFAGHVDATQQVGIICGTGNNGGDGLGVARLLSEWGYWVSVWVVRGGVKESTDFQANAARLPEKVRMTDLEDNVPPGIFEECDVLIDAIFGSGLSRPVEGVYQSAIRAINSSGKKIIAVDIPSGLFADKHSEGEVVRATHTVTFQMPKLAFFLPENGTFVGKMEVVDIGLSQDYIARADASNWLMDRKSAMQLLRTRAQFSHKGDYGKALLISGSFGKMGACVLAARAAMRAGLGLLTVHVPRCGYSIIQSAVPEAMASVDEDEKFFTTLPDLTAFNCIGAGPGLDQQPVTAAALEKLLDRYRQPMVIDADALNIIAGRKLIHKIPEASILTPHPGEFRRLVGGWNNDFDRLEKGRWLAGETRSMVVLKGAYTTTFAPDGKCYFNPTGNPGMATGGSGDVLTGLLTGLLAQHYPPLEAALLGAYLHGLAGDKAAANLGMHPLIASDIIHHLPEAFRWLAR